MTMEFDVPFCRSKGTLVDMSTLNFPGEKFIDRKNMRGQLLRARELLITRKVDILVAKGKYGRRLGALCPCWFR